MKKFLALIRADIDDVVPINDDIIDGKMDPVYENGMEFSGSVLVQGILKKDIGEETLKALIIDYAREYVEFVTIRKVEFRNYEPPKKSQFFRQTG